MNQAIQPNDRGFSAAADRFVLALGKILGWANGLLVLVIVAQVTLRYGFGRGFVALEELEWHLYSVAFMFGLSYAVVTDAHVRVDLVSGRLSEKARHWIEALGIVFLLLPFIAVVVVYGGEFFWASWVHNERSTAPLGLPWRWAIKAVIPISFVVLALAAIARLLRTLTAIRTLKGSRDAAH
jgi:TRAP-type mannitol/chloroaromatic compound transport system permease small subunit